MHIIWMIYGWQTTRLSLGVQALVISFGLSSLNSLGFGQTVATNKTQANPIVCDEELAVSLIQAQIEEIRLYENTASRISVLVRAAALLWPKREDKARAAFTDAYQLAVEFWKGVSGERSKGSSTPAEDQRFSVIQAIARHDQSWALKLTDDLLYEAKQRDEKAKAASRRPPPESVLEAAIQLLPTSLPPAVALARRTLNYPVSASLTRFIHLLAAYDRTAADELYRETLAANTISSLDNLFNLSAYPFGRQMTLGPWVQGSFFPYPDQLPLNPLLPPLFVETLLRRAELAITGRPPAPSSHEMTEAAQLYMALLELEPLIISDFPRFSAEVRNALTALAGAMTGEMIQFVQDSIKRRQPQPGTVYERRREQVERETDPARKDFELASAVIAGIEAETEENLTKLADQLKERSTREQLLDWLYVRLAQQAIKRGDLTDAARLADKISRLDLRAHLIFAIAGEAIEKSNSQQDVVERLEEVVKAADNAAETNEKARTLLGVVNLYSRIDRQRTFEVLGKAIKTINQVKAPSLTSTTLVQRIEGKTFRQPVNYNISSSSLQNVFYALGRLDFEVSLEMAGELDDRFLRSTSRLALADSCLEGRKVQRAKAGEKAKTSSPKF